MRKRKALKKGGFTNPVRAGPTIPERLSKYDTNSIQKLKETFEMNLTRAESDLNRQNSIKQNAISTYMKQKKIEETAAMNNNKSDIIKWTKIRDTASGAKNIIFGFFAMMKYIITFIFSNIKFIITTIGTAGKGAIIKAVLAILFIVLIILGATGVIYNTTGKISTVKETNDAGQAILNADDDLYNKMPENKNIFSMMFNSINNIIPYQYKYKLNYISNSVTYLTTGKNQYEDLLKDRTEITTGRSDNIFHINFSGDALPKEKTYSIIEPKKVELNFNENLYYNSDYNKIDETIRNNIKYPDKCHISVITDNNTGKYILDLASSRINYYNNNIEITTANKDLIKPIFKYANTSNLNLGVKFNNFNNYLYTSYYDAKNNVGAYATKLINPNYKGPILRLTNATREEVYTENEYKNGKKTANFYNDFNTDKLYTIINDEKVYYDNFFNNNASSVVTLYDQSGNNNDLIYKMYDFVHMPEFRLDNNNYSIYFYDQHMLLFKTKISYKKIKINTKILFSNISDAKNVIHMNFLAREKEEVIKINGSDNENLVFTTTKKTDIIDNDQISDKYKVSDNNNRVSELKNPYDISTKFIYNENKDDPIILECLGNAYDMRTFDEKMQDDTLINKKGENLQNKLKKHSFKGYLYELRIFKSDED